VQALLLDIDQARVVEKKNIYLNKLTLSERFKLLRQAGVTDVVCGHISDFFYDMLSNENIKIISGIAGGEDEVVAAFINGRLDNHVFHMPGVSKCITQKKEIEKKQR
jgi:predicted Fe-Mo cluster-binding NifX family protein